MKRNVVKFCSNKNLWSHLNNYADCWKWEITCNNWKTQNFSSRLQENYVHREEPSDICVCTNTRGTHAHIHLQIQTCEWAWSLREWGIFSSSLFFFFVIVVACFLRLDLAKQAMWTLNSLCNLVWPWTPYLPASAFARWDYRHVPIMSSYYFLFTESSFLFYYNIWIISKSSWKSIQLKKFKMNLDLV
jgi:hypothetical protein